MLGQLWCDGAADWDALASLQIWGTAFRQLTSQAGGLDMEQTVQLRRTLAQLLTEGRALVQPEGQIGRALGHYCQAFDQFNEAKQRLETLLSLQTEAAWGTPGETNAMARMRQRLGDWRTGLPGLQSWCYWRASRGDAARLGLEPLILVYEREGLPTAELMHTFERGFYQWWTESLLAQEPALRAFFSPEHERKIEQFHKLDEQYLALTGALIQARLASRVPVAGDRVIEHSEMGILQRQLQMRRRHLPIRQLFQRIPNLLPRLKPCLLMSPISVAQYLDAAHPPFDLVIFDEASQLPTWDAIGAIARGREAIIVGDPKQLPPTNFFSRSDEEEVGDNDLVEDLESILDDCIAARLPWLQLRWHYRSRHESLIAFSNSNYYDNRLLTFPAPQTDALGVGWRSVPDGVYDKGKSRTNRAEAEAIVAEILRRLRDPALSGWSIGVVTFSVPQQTLVEDLLDEARRAFPDIEAFFSPDTVEPVFVKNLENVQGDERDVILFSICYGPDTSGRVSMNFGPLNRDGGERRLNVAITRARREVMVFSTLRPEHIDLARTRARGVADLKLFLDYAERGPAAIAEAISTRPHDDFDSPFEQQVCEALRELVGMTFIPRWAAQGTALIWPWSILRHPDATCSVLSATVPITTAPRQRATATDCARPSCAAWAGSSTVSGRATGGTILRRHWPRLTRRLPSPRATRSPENLGLCPVLLTHRSRPSPQPRRPRSRKFPQACLTLLPSRRWKGRQRCPCIFPMSSQRYSAHRTTFTVRQLMPSYARHCAPSSPPKGP